MQQERTQSKSPIGLWSVIFAAVAVYGVYSTVRDVMFFSQTEPSVLRSVADLKSLKEDGLAEVHLPLNLEEAQVFQYSRSNRTFLVAPFEGAESRLFYAVERSEEGEEPPLEPPLRGRVVTRDFAGDWDVGDGKDVDLKELFPGVADDAFLVRHMTRTAVSPWQWFVTGVAVLYLLYLAFRIAAWATGSRSAPAPAGSKMQSVEGRPASGSAPAETAPQ